MQFGISNGGGYRALYADYNYSTGFHKESLFDSLYSKLTIPCIIGIERSKWNNPRVTEKIVNSSLFTTIQFYGVNHYDVRSHWLIRWIFISRVQTLA